MRYVATGDLVRRWKYTRQGVNQVVKLAGFPAPAFAVNCGRVRVWELAAVEAFEVGRPELGDEGEKRRKVAGYAHALLKAGRR